MDDFLEAWFQREILPHEAPLMRYLTQKRGIPLDPEDLRNEIYIRVLQSAERQRPATPKAFLFATARNLLIDLARRNRVVAIDLLEDLDVLNVLVDNATPERQLSGRQQLQRLSRLVNRMPARQREVLWLRRVEGLTQRASAQRLGLSEAAIEKHLYRAMRYLSEALLGPGAADGGKENEAERDAREDNGEIGPFHGK